MLKKVHWEIVATLCLIIAAVETYFVIEKLMHIQNDVLKFGNSADVTMQKPSAITFYIITSLLLLLSLQASDKLKKENSPYKHLSKISSGTLLALTVIITLLIMSSTILVV